MLPATTAERQLWSIWIGYLAGCLLAVIAMRLMWPDDLDELTLFPIWSILAGIAFFVMGSNYWGRCYAFGVAFFVAAVAIPVLGLHLGPLVFGVLWAVALGLIGLRLRSMAAS